MERYRMKILRDATVLEYPATGIAKVTVGLYTECLRQVPSLSLHAFHRRALRGKLPVATRSTTIGSFLPPGFWQATVPATLVAMERPRVVHFPWNGKVPLLPPGPVIVTTIHDVLPLIIPGFFEHREEEERRYREGVQRDVGRSDLVFTDSEFSKSEILRNFRLRREPVVLPYGPTIVPVEDAAPAATQEPYFLYVGGYHPRKGLPDLLRVFLALHREGKLRSRLVLTGTRLPMPAEFQALVEEGVGLGIVEERGYVGDDELSTLYAHALALVYPSRYEGFGLPPLEAMASGCPVITTRCTSLPEVCGDAVYYIDPADMQSIAQALTDLETMPELRASCIAKGKARSAMFTWQRAAASFLGALDATISQRKSGDRSVV